MTDAEKNACQSLLKSHDDEAPGSPASAASGLSAASDRNDIAPGSPDFESRVNMFLEKKEQVGKTESPYVNCNFVYGSTAEVERLWSTASYILRKQRRRMTPQLFESILFLRYNESLWDIDTVDKAMKEDRMQQHADRLERHVNDDETEEMVLRAVDDIEID
jgi:hypothetical protein